jgi:hypothetical protein
LAPTTVATRATPTFIMRDLGRASYALRDVGEGGR